MIYLVKRNIRHNGRVYLMGSRLNIPVLDEVLRIYNKCGVIEALVEDHKQNKVEAVKVEIASEPVIEKRAYKKKGK